MSEPRTASQRWQLLVRSAEDAHRGARGLQRLAAEQRLNLIVETIRAVLDVPVRLGDGEVGWRLCLDRRTAEDLAALYLAEHARYGA